MVNLWAMTEMRPLLYEVEFLESRTNSSYCSRLGCWLAPRPANRVRRKMGARRHGYQVLALEHCNAAQGTECFYL